MERDESSESEEEGEKRGVTYNRLRSILKRISPIEELTTFLTSHKFFQVSSDLANPNRAKSHIISDLRRHLEGEVTEDHVAAADLLLCSLGLRQRTWTTYKLTPRDEQKHTSSSSSPSGADPEQFARRLGEEIELFAPHHLHVQMHNDVLWARLRIAHLGVAVRTHIAYIAYCPRSRAVFASNIAASLHDIIIHALETALSCEVEKTKLHGKNVKALMDMMLNRDGQGPYRDYRADSHPLQQQLSAAAATDESQRRPVPSSPPLPVVVEDAEARHRTEQHLFDAFGSSPMPALDQVNFRIVDSFRGGFELGPRFECSVRFEGPNVLEGIRKLVQLGIAQPPLPHYLANLASLCQNSFDLVNPNPDTGEQNQDAGGAAERQRQRGGKRKERDETTTTTTTSSTASSSTSSSATSAQVHRDEEASQQRRPTTSQREGYGIVQRGEKRRG
ncbi:uncharacterized protein ACA1_335900 [Acanthamoeba castellanii str. Neff]|uniref:Uncharacterized protein n=1 Tax=Acanthamoeba castellanii (strain ATCC 30010 / Neff) TaxID=1257118 RepID=L8H1Q2_ACACF|nr:uncharacterized protein ACA1_335900 [Acanthamoeba castellanii str. Neff]ELR19127.1 hypothetical protein ACA1_335900 [Acanthamoeba castellanii str. Neff]